MKIIYLLHSSFFIWLGSFTASSVALTLNNTTSNTTIAAPLDITCYGPDEVRVPITVDKCRSLLKFITTLRPYRALQDFQTNRSPRLPGTPPYTWWNETTTCGLRVESQNPYLFQRFAWVQVRALAMEILDYCQDTSLGLGGLAPIGIPRPEVAIDGFSVRVIGATISPAPPPDGTDDAFGSSGTANATFGETFWLDTS